MPSKSLSRGFSLVEILAVVTIISILAGVVLLSTFNFRERIILTTESERLVSLIREARTRTTSGYNDANYGVHFEADEVTIFSGSSYVAGAGSNEVAVLDSQVELSDIDLATGAFDLTFNSLSGRASTNGTLTLSLVASSSVAKVITINEAGYVNTE